MDDNERYKREINEFNETGYFTDKKGFNSKPKEIMIVTKVKPEIEVPIV